MRSLSSNDKRVLNPDRNSPDGVAVSVMLTIAFLTLRRPILHFVNRARVEAGEALK